MGGSTKKILKTAAVMAAVGYTGGLAASWLGGATLSAAAASTAATVGATAGGVMGASQGKSEYEAEKAAAEQNARLDAEKNTVRTDIQSNGAVMGQGGATLAESEDERTKAAIRKKRLGASKLRIQPLSSTGTNTSTGTGLNI
jgi:hypothetical protein